MKDCFKCDEMLRYFLVSFMISAAYLLFVGEAVWPAFLSQLLWVSLENNLCADRSVANIKDNVIQLLILSILYANLRCCCRKEAKAENPHVEKKMKKE